MTELTRAGFGIVLAKMAMAAVDEAQRNNHTPEDKHVFYGLSRILQAGVVECAKEPTDD